MRFLRVVNRVTPPFLWDAAKSVIGGPKHETLQPCVHPSVRSYSQFGEDLVIDALLGCPSEGVYVDVGANDPEILSNTCRFYERGWRGINVEPNSELLDELRRRRPEDINLNLGISAETGELVFYRMEPATLSTFDSSAMRDNLAHSGARLAEEVRVAVEPLRCTFEKHLGGRAIDFLSVDTEGLDLQILQSNDWLAYRPRLVLVEVAWQAGEIVAFLREQGYSLMWSNGVNGIFADDVQQLEPQLTETDRRPSACP